MKFPIYLDYMATTPVDPSVAEIMSRYLSIDGVFGNAGSVSHDYGIEAKKAIDHARQQVADLIHADPQEIIFTSGATESDNLAIQGAAYFYQNKGKHIVTCKTEHKAVLDTCQYLERQGFSVTYLEPMKNGLIDPEEFSNALCDDTILVSIMHANNEIGVLQDIAALSEIAKKRGIVFHVDAAQSAGKVSIDVKQWNVDLLSLSAHKVYGPKGIGALYVRRKPRVRLEPLIHGGNQELGLRSGTLATHQIVGMGEAFAIAKQALELESQRILKLRERLWQGLKDIEGIHMNGDSDQRIPGNLNVSFDKVDGESLMLALKDLAISTASACASASVEPSYVLSALRIPKALAHSAIRLSIGRYTTEAEIDFVIEKIIEQVNRLRALAPQESI
ncbi:MAG: IscS subfamily cysteine desulfurase [Proteobacteria bacterium]|nr:IscS subfamily cysteine desulfurase [Pseudomonadota bacterium]